jgi:molybdopterin/thiamine biosynthesis adenylyltransferase
MHSEGELTNEDRAIHKWQMWVDDFGEIGQQRLKQATVLVSRCGGLGSVVAYELVAAGVGRLILAHGGNIQFSDLNRQLLMNYGAVGQSRVEVAKRRLEEFKPQTIIDTVSENVSEHNAQELVEQADLVVDCAPLFEERFALNRQAVKMRKPLVECAMYDLEAQLTTILPGKTPCLNCLYPETPPAWKREFPVFGAVSGTIGCLGAMEAIKVIARFGETLTGKLLVCDLRSMAFRTLQLNKDPNCNVCSQIDTETE